MKSLKYTDKILLIVSVLLFMIGLVMIFSSSNIAAFMRYNRSPYTFLLKQSAHLVVGMIIFYIVTCRLNIHWMSSLSRMGVAACAGLLLFANFYGVMTNHARSWINVFGIFQFQPSELAKVVLILWLATFYDVHRKHLNHWVVNVLPLFVSAILAGLIILQPDFGTAAILMLIAYLMYLLVPAKRGMKAKIVGISVLLVGIALGGYYLVKPDSFARQIARFDYFEPCSEEKFYTTGNQVCNSIIAFNNGSYTGLGLGNSTQKYLYLPESHTDFIFAIVVEELGLLFAIVIIILFFILLWRIIDIGRHSSSGKESLLCYGVAIYIFLHLVINLLGIMGWLPLTGIPLPFLSYGGTFTICLILALSMVQRVAIETKMQKK